MHKGLERLFILALFLFSFSGHAQSFIFEHANCYVKIQKQKEDNKKLEELLKKLLTNKGYKVSYLIENKKLLPKDLYMEMEITTPSGKLFKDCIVKVSLKVAKNRRISNGDKILFEREGKRQLPRVTFSGGERCRRALKDNFIHIPYCKDIGYLKEKK